MRIVYCFSTATDLHAELPVQIHVATFIFHLFFLQFLSSRWAFVTQPQSVFDKHDAVKTRKHKATSWLCIHNNWNETHLYPVHRHGCTFSIWNQSEAIHCHDYDVLNSSETVFVIQALFFSPRVGQVNKSENNWPCFLSILLSVCLFVSEIIAL